jgi:cell division protein FtsI/penicillin-binding protein 2
MTVRDEIVFRSGVVYLVLILCAVALIVQIVVLQYIQKGRWSEMSEKYVFKTAEMPANRGDILAATRGCAPVTVSYYYYT